jgi:hypothetical protein
MLGMMVFALGTMWAQDNTPPSDSQTPQPPVPAYGQGNRPSTPISENPPLSGLDLPSLEEHAAPLSYLQPGATFSESAFTNIGNTLGGSTFGSVSRGLGTLALRRLWSHYDLALDYMGGAAYYQKGGIGWKVLQDVGIAQKIEWKRGQLSLRDNFSYLPEGNFGAAYGSLGSLGIAGMENGPLLSLGSGLGALGLTPRIMNVSSAELSESLNPRSTLTATAGYAFTHFYGDDAATGDSFIGSSQLSVQGGYNRILTPHTQVAAVYGYQAFDFSIVGSAFHSHVVQGMYGHRISGRMDLLLGAGPQFTATDTQTAVCSDPTVPLEFCAPPFGTPMPVTDKSTKVGVAATARLRYRFTKDSLDLRYRRFQTSGAGLFTGAQSDVIRLQFDHPLSRIWRLTMDIGYGHNNRLQPLTEAQKLACASSDPQTSENACPAGNATTYNYGYAGAAVHRSFGRQWHGFVSYQFNELWFDGSFCASNTPCDRISNRQVVTIGLDWTPRPIRID